MTAQTLHGIKVAILVADGFEQVELVKPKAALEEAGAVTTLVSPQQDQVRGWNHHDPADAFAVDQPLARARAEDFDALLLPGGVVNPDALRIDEQAVAFVRAFEQAGKPIAAICHGPWTLIEAGVAAGKRMTSWPSLKSDLSNAGANWVDETVVVDGLLVTSRNPDDIPAFNREMVRVFGQATAAQAAGR